RAGEEAHAREPAAAQLERDEARERLDRQQPLALARDEQLLPAAGIRERRLCEREAAVAVVVHDQQPVTGVLDGVVHPVPAAAGRLRGRRRVREVQPPSLVVGGGARLYRQGRAVEGAEL